MPYYPTGPDGYASGSMLAKRAGISVTRVAMLRKEGVFDAAILTLENGRTVFNIEEAYELYKYRVDHSRGNSKYGSHVINPNVSVEAADETSRNKSASMSITEARALKEQYLAQIKKIQYEEKVGKLLLEEDVKIAAFEMYRKTRDALINIVDRVSAQLAAEINEAVIRKILEGEVRMALDHIRGKFYD